MNMTSSPLLIASDYRVIGVKTPGAPSLVGNSDKIYR